METPSPETVPIDFITVSGVINPFKGDKARRRLTVCVDKKKSGGIHTPDLQKIYESDAMLELVKIVLKDKLTKVLPSTQEQGRSGERFVYETPYVFQILRRLGMDTRPLMTKYHDKFVVVVEYPRSLQWKHPTPDGEPVITNGHVVSYYLRTVGYRN
jgi:hypothetical protein